MLIKYNNKPDTYTVENFSTRIAELLAAHPITIELELRDYPVRLDFYVDNRHTGSEHRWIETVVANYGPSAQKIPITLFNRGIAEGMSDPIIWNEAYHIQNEVYKILDLNYGAPGDGNPYWQLWRHLKRKM